MKKLETCLSIFVHTYAMQKKNLSFKFNSANLWDFFTTVTISCYNFRSQYTMYWTLSKDVNCLLVACLQISRNQVTSACL